MNAGFTATDGSTYVVVGIDETGGHYSVFRSRLAAGETLGDEWHITPPDFWRILKTFRSLKA